MNCVVSHGAGCQSLIEQCQSDKVHGVILSEFNRPSPETIKETPHPFLPWDNSSRMCGMSEMRPAFLFVL